MNKKVILIAGIILLATSINARSQEYYWIAFTDKNQTDFSLDEPHEYLSDRAIQRRIRQDIPIDSLDLPVNTTYIQQVLDLGVEFVHASKWLNGITVKSEIDSFSTKVLQLPFVKEVQLSKPDLSGTKSGFNKFDEISEDKAFADEDAAYGMAIDQIDIMNGLALHNKNY